MSRPHALLRVGFSYERTLGMRRLTNEPVDVAIGGDGDLHILCRGAGRSSVRRISMDDDDLGSFNLGSFNLSGAGVQAVTKSKVSLDQFGTPIGGTTSVNGTFAWPASMVMDEHEHLWVSDEGAHRISWMTTSGEQLGGWGEMGDGDGQLNRPSGIAFDPEGNVYVSDTLNHRVHKFTRDGQFILKFGAFGDGDGELNMPWGIAVDELGDVYVADWRNDRVQKFTAEGELIFKIGTTGCEDGEMDRPSGVAVDKDGDIYVVDRGNDRVQLFDCDGRFVEKFIGDATLSKQARGYMMSNQAALRLREMTSLEPQKRLRTPISVRTDGDGRMYVTDYGSDRVQVYRKEAIPLGPDEIGAPRKSPTLFTQF